MSNPTTALNLNGPAFLQPAAPPSFSSVNLTAEDLLTYCSTRMQDLDTNIQGALKSQDTKLKEQQALQSFQEVVKKFGDKGPQNQDDWNQIENAYTTLQQAIGDPSDPVMRQVDDFMNQARAETHPGQDVGAAQKGYDDAKADYDRAAADSLTPYSELQFYQSQMDQAKANLDTAKNPPFKGLPDTQWAADGGLKIDNILTSLKGGAELDMIQLQSMVSQRQTVVQLVTGMMSKFDQTQETIAGKIGG